MALRTSGVVVLPAISKFTPVVDQGPTPEKHSTTEAISDGVISAKVKVTLHEDPLTEAYDIQVETFKGTVQLHGFVETTDVRIKALLLARNVEGVLQVEDALDIRRA